MTTEQVRAAVVSAGLDAEAFEDWLYEVRTVAREEAFESAGMGW